MVVLKLKLNIVSFLNFEHMIFFQLTYTLLNYVLTLKEGMPPELNRPRFEYGPIGKAGDISTHLLLAVDFYSMKTIDINSIQFTKN